MIKISVIVFGIVFLSACSTSRPNAPGSSLEGIWKLNRVECVGSRLTDVGNVLNERLKNGYEILTFKYGKDASSLLFGKASAGRPDHINFCEMQGDLKWKEGRIPSACELNSKTVRRGSVNADICKYSFSVNPLFCLAKHYEVEDQKMKLQVPQVLPPQMAEQKFCSDKDAHLIFERVL